ANGGFGGNGELSGGDGGNASAVSEYGDCIASAGNGGTSSTGKSGQGGNATALAGPKKPPEPRSLDNAEFEKLHDDFSGEQGEPGLSVGSARAEAGADGAAPENAGAHPAASAVTRGAGAGGRGASVAIRETGQGIMVVAGTGGYGGNGGDAIAFTPDISGGGNPGKVLASAATGGAGGDGGHIAVERVGAKAKLVGGQGGCGGDGGSTEAQGRQAKSVPGAGGAGGRGGDVAAAFLDSRSEIIAGGGGPAGRPGIDRRSGQLQTVSPDTSAGDCYVAAALAESSVKTVAGSKKLLVGFAGAKSRIRAERDTDIAVLVAEPGVEIRHGDERRVVKRRELASVAIRRQTMKTIAAALNMKLKDLKSGLHEHLGDELTGLLFP
ncbi:MAG: hypothetical protein ABJK67_07840, partial [Anderseniella sp.]